MLAIEAGEAVWIAAAATGVAALLATSVSALSFLRFAGTAYLLYIGLQRWRPSENIQATPRAELGKVFVQGFVTQLLNLKVALFFVALLASSLVT
jgi:threonine/homoserine/homoserine lactone efflux protein